MLPNEGPLTEQHRAEVRAALQAYLAKHGITKREVSKQVGGLSVPTITQLIKGTYHTGAATIDEHLRELNDWMEVDARRRQSKPDDQFVETRVAQRLLGAAARAAESRTMALAHGPSGIGKSMVAHVIAEKFPGAILLRIGQGENTYAALRSILATRLRLRSRRKRRANTAGLTLNELIFDALRDSHRMIIVDEAHEIAQSGLKYLRDIFDNCGVPILMLATKDLLDRIREDSDEDHGQLYSRVGYVCDLTHGFDKVPGGKQPLFTVGEIRRLFERGKVRLAADGRQFLQDVANTLGQGSLRRCRDILRWAEGIERAIKHLGPDQVVTLGAAVLYKAETEPRLDRSMLDDINSRRAPVAKSA